jgi:pyruvate,water dikinase
MRVVWLGETACHDRDLVGGKAAYLSRLAAEHQVPPGFVLTASVGGATPEAQQGDDLALAYGELASRSATIGPPVAVRSAALAEDGAAASFAGQHETYLNVAGVEAIADAIRRCRESAEAPRALAYRRSQ